MLSSHRLCSSQPQLVGATNAAKGGTGMIGSPVVAELEQRGHQVIKASRSGSDGTTQLDANDADAQAPIGVI